jgi:hypothetical protein
MIRSVLFTCTILVAGALVPRLAVAAGVPPTGTLNCSISGGPGAKAGAAILKPPLPPSIPDTKSGSVKASKSLSQVATTRE